MKRATLSKYRKAHVLVWGETITHAWINCECDQTHALNLVGFHYGNTLSTNNQYQEIDQFIKENNHGIMP
jgi:hypothetical protein